MSNTAQRLTPEYEIVEDNGTIRYQEHGYPSDLIRWHAHDDYELHYIVATSGKVFIGDYIGNYSAGQLILTGPRLPHNWICQNDQTAVELRDMIIRFDHESFSLGMKTIPELAEVLPLLAKAKSGIEFLNIDHHYIRQTFEAVRASSGLTRLTLALPLLQHLAQSADYRLLSTVQIDLKSNEALQRKINTVVDYVTQNYDQDISLADVSSLIGMSDSHFSRFFKKATGNRFIEFVNRVRISRACNLLTETDDQIANICFQVGFNNVANFNRRFHELKGVTPRDFRTQSNLNTKTNILPIFTDPSNA
ncbi:helix-turn-helix domain-containing protein [Marinomonas posidonica]|uniref:Transcriptional regulator, AraC family n=1 Tax=Marinomonas posidonica (strain CECT 7376 / NCIMB 14433 / IVIA-Po-181) TaxID=491952 RepID=F6CZH3_MARPP|nr:AraC family transcriptional regulator [Marinomonas posidonica]AEF55785.1 transcriptional regulator, AraC family [Marinomonas posidonica IVIA-Po-181]